VAAVGTVDARRDCPVAAPLFRGARGAVARPGPVPASAPEPSDPAASASEDAAAEPAPLPAPRDRPRPPRRRREEPPPAVPAPAAAPAPSSSPSRCGSLCWLEERDCPLRPLPDGTGTASDALGNGGAGRVSPIFGLGDTAAALVPLASGPDGSGLREPFATSGASAARSGAPGTDAGRPVVGSNIGEIPSKGRAGERRGWHRSSSTAGSWLSSALGQVAEIECENTLFVVSFAGPRERLGDGTVGDSEKDVASYGRSSDRNGRNSRVRLCEGA